MRPTGNGFNRAVAARQTRLAGKAVMTRATTAAGAAIGVEMSFALVCDARGEVLGSVAVAGTRPSAAPVSERSSNACVR